MIGRLSQRRAVQRLSGVVGGAKLLARRPFLVSATDTAPAGTAFMTVRAVGGGTGGLNSGGGGGGAFARATVPCSPGEQSTVTVGAGGAANTFGGNSSVVKGGVTVCLAVGGAGNSGGQAANCIGDVAYSGGNPGQAGVNGGDGGATGNWTGGGGSGGERNANDCIVVGGNGAYDYGVANGIIIAGFPGGGGTRNNNAPGPPGGARGIIYIDYWSAKP